MTVHTSLRPVLLRILVASSLVAGFLGATSPVRADHLDGTYSGNIDPPAGGTFSLTVSGNTVTNFTAQGMTGFNPPMCGPAGGSVSNVPIDTSGTVHGFGPTPPPVQVAGHFNPDGTVEGTVIIEGSCDAQGDYKGPNPCHCSNANTDTKFHGLIKKLTAPGPVMVAGGETTVVVQCAGKSPPDCKATFNMNIKKNDKDVADLKKSDDKPIECTTADCPKQFEKKIAWKIKIEEGSVPETINGTMEIKCDGKTLVFKWKIVIKANGTVDRKKTEFDIPA